MEKKKNPAETENDISYAYERFIESDPDNAYDYYIVWGNELSVNARSDRDDTLFEKALEKYKKAVVLNPNNNKAYIRWAVALADYQSQDNNRLNPYLSEALEKARKAIKLSPCAEAYSAWGYVLLTMGRDLGVGEQEEILLEAIDKFKKAAHLDQNNGRHFADWAKALFLLSMEKNDNSIFEECTKKYDLANRLEPNDVYICTKWAKNTSDYALFNEDEKLYKRSLDLYAKAYEIDRDELLIVKYWAEALANYAELANDAELYRQAANKYMQYSEACTENCLPEGYYYNIVCGYMLIRQSKINDTLHEDHNRIKTVIEKGADEYPDIAAREMARIYSLLNSVEPALEWLEKYLCCEEDGDAEYLMEDDDFANIRQDLRFYELLDKYQKASKDDVL